MAHRLSITHTSMDATVEGKLQARQCGRLDLSPLRTAVSLGSAVDPPPIRQRHPPRVHQMRAVLRAIAVHHNLVAQLDVALLEATPRKRPWPPAFASPVHDVALVVGHVDVEVG